MKSFDLLNASLEGVNLIEAGAGTGKTYTLAGLFLRLVVEQGLGIDQILVVTFTKAATEELKNRIRMRLLTAKSVFGGAKATDELLAHLVSSAQDPEKGLQRIQDALTDFDRAAIFTIHGFCQRVLQQFAFETGHLFRSELVQDAQPFLQEVVDDFWRRHISRAPGELAGYALAKLKGPDQLVQVLNYCRYPNVRILPNTVKPNLKTIAPFRRAAAKVRELWPQVKDDVMALLQSPGLNATYYGKCVPDPDRPHLTQRQIRMMALAQAMSRWNGRYPLCDHFDRFSTKLLAKATKKGYDTPDHPFLHACDQTLICEKRMTDQMDAYLRYLKVRLHRQAQQRLDLKKAKHNILFFDDLLLQVHHALMDKHRGFLVRAVRQQYKAALVDEFQDTDPLQYEIFSQLFADPQQLLIMIGDPKQAIYSFRGADLFSYLKAVDKARTKATLTRNWRSTPALIQAINTIFSNHSRPFGFEKIDFERAVAAHDDDGMDQTPPLRLWCLTRTKDHEKSTPLSQAEVLPKIVEAVAEEIFQLLSNPDMAVAPKEIAVLTRKHQQSQLIKEALVQRKIPAVLHSAGRVFDTNEAEHLARVLKAVANPSDARCVRAALCIDFFGVNAQGFDERLPNPSRGWQLRWDAFNDYHHIWINFGFYLMFRKLMARERIKARLLDLADGERRLTNLLHLAELAHQAEVEQRLGPDGLIKWLANQRLSGQKGSDDQQLRLESDARAVRIITMHKSKGLQFEVVFCPFLWSGVRADKNAAMFHDPRKEDRLTLALGPDILPDYQLQAQKEALAENIRLLYVALTRAKRRCYMVWGRIKNTEISAPAYLMHNSELSAETIDWVGPLKKKMSAMTDAQFIMELEQLASRSRGTISVEPPPGTSTGSYSAAQEASIPLSHRTLGRGINTNWRIASFSSLTAGLADHDSEWPDRDGGPSKTDTQIPVQGNFNSMFAFPKGVHAGLFFHDLLEHWDHTQKDSAQRICLVTEKLSAYGFDQRWADTVGRMLDDLATADLVTRSSQFSLAQVPVDGRINEMEFYFALKSFSADEVCLTFEKFAGQAVNNLLGPHLARLTFVPLEGFMKGYIDMVFRHHDRYYLVDWKSNYLGAQFEDYETATLDRTMAEDYYFLQYHLYVLALDQLLRQKLDSYDYKRHFGGVFYIFLRGIGNSGRSSNGIYYAKPRAELVDALARLLIRT